MGPVELRAFINKHRKGAPAAPARIALECLDKIDALRA
jgi:hypothetical protein